MQNHAKIVMPDSPLAWKFLNKLDIAKTPEREYYGLYCGLPVYIDSKLPEHTALGIGCDGKMLILKLGGEERAKVKAISVTRNRVRASSWKRSGW